MEVPINLAATAHSISVNYCFEIEFLVAKQRPEDDPYFAILDRCKDLLVQNNEPVIICCDPDYDLTQRSRFNSEESGDSDRFGYWNLAPSNTARTKKGAPPEYDCLKWALAALRMGLTMHVNSTCRFSVHIEPEGGPLTLLAAKKLTTLVWILEKELLLRLCPNSQGVPLRHVKPIDTRSRIALAHWKGQVETSRPQDPLRAGIMDQYLPPLHDNITHERLHVVWGAATLQELSKGLCCDDGSPSSFAINIYDDDALNGIDPPTVEFRYALWHPYQQLDASNYWIRLAINIFKATAYEGFEFKRYIESIDRTIKGFARGVPSSSRWKILLDKLQLSEDWAGPWEKIVDEYKDGRFLGYPSIDRQPMSNPIEEFEGYP
ncbi:hypothetical protein PT974_05075 [Cladobotryum mycophilum]|uniref:Uncharacterized protein n=1 Tax=Cladobotryum mycophilum TaxID=491253 RepID=A0ABR0SS89_9HYPO